MRCSKCLNDKTVRRISFNEKGECNFCRDYKKIKSQLDNYENLEKLFKDRIKAVKGKHKYDVVLGISGGKDSVFVLHQLTTKYKLKIKTFTMNNGLLTESAKKNIDKTVKEFGVEHEYVGFDEELLKELYHFSMQKYLTPCIACAFIGYAAMINYAMKSDAGMCIHGRSPEQMLRGYSGDVFSNFIDLGLKPIKEIDINKEYETILNNCCDALSPKIAAKLKEILYHDASGSDFREFVPYFLYHEYDEEKIVNFLKKNTSWRPPKKYDHYDCAIHNAAKYIYQCAEGRPHRLPETSVLVRSGKINKEKAKEILDSEKIVKKPKEELKKLCEFANVNENILFMKAEAYKWYRKIR